MQLFQTNIFFQFGVNHFGNSPMATECRSVFLLMICDIFNDLKANEM